MLRPLLLLSVLAAGCTGDGVLTDETPTPAGDPFTPIALDDHPLFDRERVLAVDLTMLPADWDALRTQSRSFFGEFSGDCRGAPFSSPYTYFPADVVVDGEALANIGVRKKGFIGSQSTTKPSLRLNLDEYVDGAEIGGADNITLNNARQDPSLIKQCLVYDVFAAAGLPSSRCTLARVSVNGEDLGLYAHVEPVKRSFLRERFGNDDGDLYEATLSDFEERWLDTFEPKTDDTDPSRARLHALADDLDGGGDLTGILESHLDLDAFLTFWAVESWTGHWDGYAGNQNNAYVYVDPDTDRMAFIPWGVDGTLAARADQPAHFATGLLANRAARDPDLLARYLDRVAAVGAFVWDEDALQAEIDRLEALIAGELGAATPTDAIDAVRDFVAEQRERMTEEVEPKPFRSPFCMQEVGSIAAEFETTWGSAAGGFDGIWEAGDLDMTVTWGPDVVPFSSTGVMAGPAEGDPGRASIVLAGRWQAQGGTALLIPVLTVPTTTSPGTPLDLGTQAGAALYYVAAETGYEPTEAGALSGGAVTFDAFGTTPGAAIHGSLDTTIWGWTEIE